MYKGKTLLLHFGLYVVRQTGGEVVGVVFHELGEGARFASHYVMLSSSQEHTAAVRTSEKTPSTHSGE